MIVVRLLGGAGNQIFQYAFGKALKAAGNEVKFDRSYFDNDSTRAYVLDRWNTSVEFAGPVGDWITDDGLRYKPELIKKYHEDCTFSGYWQSENYFKNVDLSQDLSLRRSPSEKSLEVAQQISLSNSVFLHIRRTDTLAARGKAFHGLIPLDYYHRSIRYLADRIGKFRLFVFSDDIEWCKQNLPWADVFVDHNKPGVSVLPDNEVQKTTDGTEEEDLWLMSLCKHGITANSSFSWWGGYLIQNPAKIVISPDQWFVGENNGLSRDLIPWLRL